MRVRWDPSWTGVCAGCGKRHLIIFGLYNDSHDMMGNNQNAAGSSAFLAISDIPPVLHPSQRKQSS